MEKVEKQINIENQENENSNLNQQIQIEKPLDGQIEDLNEAQIFEQSEQINVQFEQNIEFQNMTFDEQIFTGKNIQGLPLQTQQSKDKPLLYAQLIFIFVLIFMKYGSQFLSPKFKFNGLQNKIFGSFILCQSLLMNQKVAYSEIWSHGSIDFKILNDAIIIAILFFLSVLHFIRLSHYLPSSFKNDYQLIADRIIDKNQDELNLTSLQSDIVYENKNFYFTEEFQYTQTSFFDYTIMILDFVFQLGLALILFFILMGKDGYIDIMSSDTSLYEQIRKLGLTKSLSIVAIFSIFHLNQSKYIGISNLDSWQYFFVRCLSIILPFFVIIQSDFNGTLKYHFEQLLVSVIWMFYFIFSDWKKSKENQIAINLEDVYDKEDIKSRFRKQYAEKSKERVVLILFRIDGKGGIQGIVLDSFYIDNNGSVANEFYIVSDSMDGEIKKIEDDSIKLLRDPIEIQKAFHKYFLQPQDMYKEIACNYQN